MRVLLLAAGYGTRLLPLTRSIPKCLVPIHGQPLLEIWLQRLTAAGFGPFLINTHYLSDQVEAFVSTSPFRDRVALIHEPTLSGTAGTLIANLDYFAGDSCLLIHADNYCLADFSAFAAAHERRPPECIMTMMTFRTENPAACGIVEVDDRGVVTGFHEKSASAPGNLANGAVYILSQELLIWIGKNLRNATDFSTEVMPRFVGRIHTYETSDAFSDIGTPESYEAANRGPARGT